MQGSQLSKTVVVDPDIKGVARSTHDRELRLALSLRGGVSLAVWIGGAVAELDRLKRAPNVPSASAASGVEGVYTKLRNLANYNSVTIDVITGASAGGLNGVLYTASLVYGFEFEKIAQIWVQWTDIEALSRETHGFVSEQARSLLDGDGYFLKLVEDQLSKLVAEGTDAVDLEALGTDDPRLELLLTATLADPVQLRFSLDRFADILDSRRSAFFHFGHLGEIGGPFSNFGAPSDQDATDLTIKQLALAARASSSFPFAFEPATVGGQHTDKPDVPMNEVFSEDATAAVEVIDGGTLDNIPVAKAIDAIAAAPAQGPTNRWLIYLHPSPEAEKASSAGPSAVDKKGLRTVITNLRTAANAAISQESLGDDLIELEQHNAGVFDRRATRDAIISSALHGGTTPVEILDPAGPWMEKATENWLAVEASRIITLAETPREASVRRAMRSMVIPPRWKTADYRRLRRQAVPALKSPDPRNQSLQSDRPCLPDLIEITETLLGWANALQSVHLEDSSLTQTKLAKRQLYRVRLLLDTLTSVWEDEWIEGTGGQRPSDLDAHIRERHTKALRRSESAKVDAWVRVRANIEDPGTDDPRDADAIFHRALARLTSEATSPDSPRTAVCEDLWVFLVRIVRVLDEATKSLVSDDDVILPLDIQWIQKEPESAETLKALAIVLSSQLGRAPSSSSSIEFARLSGANNTELQEFFGDIPLTAKDKLIGNELANFGAFFSAKGRANDWMWGRIDATKTIVDVVLAGWQSPSKQDPVQEIKDIITHPFPDGNSTEKTENWDNWCERHWTAEKEEEIREEVAARVKSFTNEELSEEERQSAELTKTKKLLTKRLQAEILAQHQPWVDKIEEAAHTEECPLPNNYRDPNSLAKLKTSEADTFIREFAIPASIDPTRWASIGMRLGLVTWRALTGKRWSTWLFALKPLYLYVLAIAVQPRRALFAGMLGFGGLAVGDWQTYDMRVDALCCDTIADPQRSWQRVLAWLIVAFCVFALNRIESRQPDRTSETKKERVFHWARDVVSIVILIAVTHSVWADVVFDDAEWVLPPGIIVLAGAAVALLLFTFMKWQWHLAAVVFTVGLYVFWAWYAPGGNDGWWFERGGMSSGWWAIVGYLSVTYGVTLAMSRWDVFRPRPKLEPLNLDLSEAEPPRT